VNERIVFQVELEPEADPISGTLRLGERELDFQGWVALAGALESVLDENVQNDKREEA
jgi:hypothetical protein